MNKKRSEKLWDAMLVVFPAIVVQDLKMAPKGCAQLVREHAQALLREWELVEWRHRRGRKPGEEGGDGDD